MKRLLIHLLNNNTFLLLFLFLNFHITLSFSFSSSRSVYGISNDNNNEIYADYISSSLSNLLRSKTISLNRYKVRVSGEEINLSFYPFKNTKSIRFSDLVILRKNKIFLKKITSIKKYLPDDDYIKQRQLNMIMHLIQRRYSNLEDCRLFYNEISENNPISLIKLKHHPGNIHNRIFNILCFSSQDDAVKFDDSFKISYNNYLKSKDNGLAFIEAPCPDKKLVKVEFSVSKIKGKKEGKWKKGYLNILSERIILHEDKSNSNVIFEFKSLEIKNCHLKLDFNHNKKSICIQSKLIVKKKVRLLITICPIRTTETQALIDYKYLVNNIGVSCVNSINRRFEETFDNKDNSCELFSIFKGHSDKFIDTKIIDFISHKFSLTKENASDTELKNNLKIFLETLCKRFINNFLENSKNKEIKDYISKNIDLLKNKKTMKRKVKNEKKVHNNVLKKRCKKKKETNKEIGYRGCNRTLDKDDKNLENKTLPINHTNLKKNCTCVKKNNQIKPINKTSERVVKEKEGSVKKIINETKIKPIDSEGNQSKKIKKNKKVENAKNKNSTQNISKENPEEPQEKESEETCKNNTLGEDNENLNVQESDNLKQENSIYQLYKSYFNRIEKSMAKNKNHNLNSPEDEKEEKEEKEEKPDKDSPENEQNKTDHNIILFKSNLPITLKPDTPKSKTSKTCLSVTKNSTSCNDSESINNKQVSENINNKQLRKKIHQECNKNDIYCLCKNHPQYKDCVCLAYPKSVVCMKNYCADHCDEYECNPNRCDEDENEECEKCYCKDNMNDIKCKCKTNPYSEECFCLQYPLSHLCNKRSCQFNPNSLFCACKTIMREDLCSPRYCVDNSQDAYCKCITNPMSEECRCLNDPRSCSKSDFIDSIVDFDLKIRDSCSANKLFYNVNPFDVKSNSTNLMIKDPSIDITLIDPNIIYNMYYPHCDKNSSSSSVEPCMPFPPPPLPCNKTENLNKESVALNSNNGPCLNISPDGICLNSNGKKIKDYSLLKNSVFSFNKNKNNLYNLKKLHDIKTDKQLVILYHKLLLFNYDKTNEPSS